LGSENQPPIVVANGALSLALDRNGKVYAAGDNNFGQLGLGDKENRDAFTEVAKAIKTLPQSRRAGFTLSRLTARAGFTRRA
jgi:alpha-tubulin suppressor-like RCC1 family protein